MKTVYIVDGETRLVLPSTQWSFSVREKLSQMGHRVMPTGQDPETLERGPEEMSRVDAILDSTGL